MRLLFSQMRFSGNHIKLAIFFFVPLLCLRYLNRFPIFYLSIKYIDKHCLNIQVFFLPTCSKLEGERDRTLLANRNQLQILGISFHIENNELCWICTRSIDSQLHLLNMTLIFFKQLGYFFTDTLWRSLKIAFWFSRSLWYSILAFSDSICLERSREIGISTSLAVLMGSLDVLYYKWCKIFITDPLSCWI